MYNKPWKPQPDILFSSEKKNPYKGNDHVAVVVTNYNYEKYVIDCLDSIAAQTHKPLSLVVIDDNSCEDNSRAEILKWMTDNEGRFVSALLLHNVMNQGPSASRNTAIELCSAESIFVIDADNEIFPTAISKLHAGMVRAGADAIYSQIVEFGARSGIGSADLWDVQRMYKNNYVDVMSLIKRSAWSSVGGFSHIEEGWEDYDFWLKVIDKGLDVVFLPEILCRYRVHSTSRTATEAYKSHFELETVMRYRHPSPPRTALAGTALSSAVVRQNGRAK